MLFYWGQQHFVVFGFGFTLNAVLRICMKTGGKLRIYNNIFKVSLYSNHLPFLYQTDSQDSRVPENNMSECRNCSWSSEEWGGGGVWGGGCYHWPWNSDCTGYMLYLHLQLGKDSVFAVLASSLRLSWGFLGGATCSLKLMALTK